MAKIIPPVLITMGDPSGVGPEIIVSAFKKDKSLFQSCRPVVIGDLSVLVPIIKKKKIKSLLLLEKDKISESSEGALNLIDSGSAGSFETGKINKKSGQASVKYIDIALDLLKKNEYAYPLVTAPVSKEAIMKTGIKFDGHTEYLAEKTGTRNVSMVFVSKEARVLLVTRHIAIKDISKYLSKKLIIEQVFTSIKTLNRISPVSRVIVCGLNPHCGEAGRFGNEEERILKPAISELAKREINVTGPVPADWLFYSQGTNIPKDSLVVCLYHDQAMIPLKSIYGAKIVNLACGLKFIRTSPAHGTAFDIAGKDKANPESMIEAIKLAISC